MKTFSLVLGGVLVGCATHTAPPKEPVVPPAPAPVPVPVPTPVPSPPPPVVHIPAPVPLDGHGKRVDWWFAFKFNTATFAGCNAEVACAFGGAPKHYALGEGEQFAVATSVAPALAHDGSCVGEGREGDPVGMTFRQVYEGNPYFVVWNDQFYRDPDVCGESCGAPWAHSKGVVAWNEEGEGFVMQVSTPSWPGAGSKEHPRAASGNTLGCVEVDNVIVSQHFFALRLTHEDLKKTIGALAAIRVVTDPRDPQIVRNGGPEDIRVVVDGLKAVSKSTTAGSEVLSTGVRMISKPARLHVAPWQLVSSMMGGQPLRVASWWNGASKLPTTAAKEKIECWDDSLAAPGAVEIATSGRWEGKTIGLKGGNSKDGNHAKIGVTTARGTHAVILGDMNQEGSLSGPKCEAAQNGRGGLFFAVENEAFHASVSKLLAGQSAPKSL